MKKILLEMLFIYALKTSSYYVINMGKYSQFNNNVCVKGLYTII
jgi:hypothetical protein